MKKPICMIISLLLSMCFLASVFWSGIAFAAGTRTLGHGPVENEIGFPLLLSADSGNQLWVLDALKSSMCIFSDTFVYVSSWSLPFPLPSTIHFLDMQIRSDFCWIMVNDFIYQLSRDGKLMKELNLKTLAGIHTKTIQQFAVVSDSVFVFVDSLTNEALLLDTAQPDQMAVPVMENNLLLLVKDVQSYQNLFYFLCQDSLNSFETTYSLYQYNSQGFILRKTTIDRSNLVFPIGISVNSSGDCYLYSETFQYNVYNTELNFIKSVDSVIPDYKNYQPELTAYSSYTVLMVHPYQGIFSYNGSDIILKISVSKKDTSLLMPSSVCGNNQQVIAYDLITKKLHYYYYEIWKSSFPISFMQSSPTSVSNIQLFQSSGTDIFISSQGMYLRLFKYNPSNWSGHEIDIPSYIPPQCAIYIRNNDNRLFFYSWLDSLLYSFSEGSSTPAKIQIPKVEKASSMNLCKICIDEAGYMFLLLPSVNKVYVFDPSGSLTHQFSLKTENYYGYSDIKLFQNHLIFSNYAQSQVEFYTKKGDWVKTYGSKGSILYPKQSSSYSDQTDRLNYPVSINTYENTIWITDTGNSRVIVYQGETSPELIKIELQIGSKSAYINGNRIELEAPPFTENGRTLVPLRFIGEAFGASIEWDAATKTVTYRLGSTIIIVVIGSQTAIVNNEKKILEVPPKLVNGRTFVPLRFISESFGASVIWEAATKKIYIEFNKPTS